METTARTLARGLGWLSALLGAPALLAPRLTARAIGVRPTDGTTAVLRGVGVQELVVAAALLRRRRPVGWQWSRVAGDLAHLGLLATAVGARGSDERRVGRTLLAVLACAAVDLAAALLMARAPALRAAPVRARRVLTIRRAPEDVYAFWRDLTHLPSFMTHLRSVEAGEDGRTHWVADAPGGATVEWDAEVVEDVPGEVLAWRSVEGAEVPNEGRVRFRAAPAGQGTELDVELSYDPPGGRLGAVVAKVFGEEPEQQLADDLRRCKQVLETGEVVRSDGTPQGADTRQLLGQRPAHPLEEGTQG